MLPEKEKAKIPEKWYQLIETKRDKDYKFNTRDEDITLLPDTEKILSVIYTDYLASEEERKIIKAKENSFLKKNYNEEIKTEEAELKKDHQKSMIKHNRGFFSKICSKIIATFLKGKK